MRTRTSLSRLLLMGLLTILVSGCRHEKAKDADDPSNSTDPIIRQAFSAAAKAGGAQGHPVNPHQLSQSQLRYGRPPQPAPGLEYQDGVILMENGDKAIRGFGSDGLTWIIDASAPHANEIQVDKIIFATDRCVGRVLDVQKSGDELKVILGPIQLTDVIKRGHFVYDQPVDLNNLVAVAAPDYPGAPDSDASQKMKESGQTSLLDEGPSVEYAVVTPSGEWKPMPTISPAGTPHLMNASLHPPAMTGPGRAFMQEPYFPNWPNIPEAPMPTIGGIPQVNLPNMLMHPCFTDCGGLGLHLYSNKGGVKVDVWAVFYMAAPHLTFNIDVSPGYVRTAAIQLSGGAGFSISFQAGSMQDFQTNMHQFGQVPLSIELPVAGLGVPLVVKLSNTFKLDTAFSAKTSVLKARGDYNAGGALTVGYVDGKWGASGMKMDLKHNLADSVDGISVGMNSLVFGVNQTLLVGLGAFGFSTGPYVSLVSTITALDQSSIVLRSCKQGTFNMSVYAGIGWSIPKVVASVVNFFLSLVHVKPVQASGDVVRMKDPKVLVDRRDETPAGCAGH
jgi:hypothetical protein